MSNKQPYADRTLKQRGWQNYLLVSGGHPLMNDEPVGEQSRNIGFKNCLNLWRYIDGQSDVSTGLTHQICNERKQTGTPLTHLSGYERNTTQQIAQQFT